MPILLLAFGLFTAFGPPAASSLWLNSLRNAFCRVGNFLILRFLIPDGDSVDLVPFDVDTLMSLGFPFGRLFL